VNDATRAADAGLVGCRICGLVVDLDAGVESRCPRCNSELRRRIPGSVSRTIALLTAAFILYIPANLMPVMHTQSLANGSNGLDSTILSGVREFWESGSWDIALIIFIASILIPSTKFLVLGALLIHARPATQKHSRRLMRLYRLLEIIGYWSMLDVLVVGLVTAVVKFRGVSDAEPRIGILFFGMVVVLTMLATQSFDPRLLWDRRPSPA
jgi:paraquat-inducible protein A